MTQSIKQPEPKYSFVFENNIILDNSFKGAIVILEANNKKMVMSLNYRGLFVKDDMYILFDSVYYTINLTMGSIKIDNTTLVKISIAAVNQVLNKEGFDYDEVIWLKETLNKNAVLDVAKETLDKKYGITSQTIDSVAYKNLI